MKTHEKHINTTIDLVKEEMFLMGEADKVGSDIEKYLYSLESVLERELASIMEVKEKVIKIKKDFNESQRIENLLVEESKKYYPRNEPEVCLLDDDDHLFN